MKAVYLAILVWILVMNTAMSGERTGNGGDVLICANEVVLLDYFESRFRGGKNFVKGRTLRETYQKIASRLHELDQFLAEEVNEVAFRLIHDIERFNINRLNVQQATIFTDEELTDINDAHEILIPRGCTKKQLIINTLQEFRLAKRFVINIELWKKLDINQQAYTVFHEALYDILVKHGASNSILARYLVGNFISDLYLNYSLIHYLEDISNLNNYRYRISTEAFSISDSLPNIKVVTNKISNCLHWVNEVLKLDHQTDTCVALEHISAEVFRDNAIYRRSSLIKGDVAFLPFSAVLDSKGRTQFIVAIPLEFMLGRYRPIKYFEIDNVPLNNIVAPLSWETVIARGNAVFEVYLAYPVLLIDSIGTVKYVRYNGATIEVEM